LPLWKSSNRLSPRWHWLLAALGVSSPVVAGNWRLAGEQADGVLLNYLPASHVPWCVEQVCCGGNATNYTNVHVGVGDRAAAAPQAWYDLFSHADQALVAATIGAHRRAGVDVPVVFPLTWGAAGQDSLESTLRAAIAPAARDGSGS
jgi:hypothetical protein